MLPVFKPTVELKIWGDLPQSSIRGLELDPEPFHRYLLINYYFESLGFTGPGVAFGARAFLKAKVTRI